MALVGFVYFVKLFQNILYSKTSSTVCISS